MLASDEFATARPLKESNGMTERSATIRRTKESPAPKDAPSPDSPQAQEEVATGHRLSIANQFAEAEIHFRRAIELQPTLPIAHNNLGSARMMQGDSNAAIDGFRAALRLDPKLRLARRNLAALLVRVGRRAESLPLWYDELREDEAGLAWAEALVSAAMRQSDLSLAGEYASILAELRWSSSVEPRSSHSGLKLPVRPVDLFLTIPKLRHDIEQFEYLQDVGVFEGDLTAVIEAYRRQIDRLSVAGADPRVPLDADARKSIGKFYSRIIHVRPTPRTDGRLWGSWDPEAVERQYLDKALGLVVIDDFLSADVLRDLRLFCHESTVWFANRYGHGRLGAFFNDGFNSPLLLQIAEGLRRVLPRVIVDRYPLRQLWAFKNGEYLPEGSTTHADFAAVNLNFWITPDEANLDASSGGLIVYDVDAPPSWDFVMYNGRQDLIAEYLREQNARAVVIPYRANRAILFNSDLFHASAGLRFRPGYQNRRVNITMLYGDRENDVHHANLARTEGSVTRASRGAWRSAAFGMRRSRPRE